MLFNKYIENITNNFKKNEQYDKHIYDKYVLNKNVNIELNKYINIYQEFHKLIYNKLESLSKLTDDEIKNIININSQIMDIQKIFTKKQNDLNKLSLNKYNILNRLVKIYYDRKTIFKSITEKITLLQKKKLMQIYKSEKIPDENRIVTIAKSFKINSENIVLWFKWIDKSFEYIKIKTELDTNIDNYINLIEKNNTILNELLIHQGKVGSGDYKYISTILPSNTKPDNDSESDSENVSENEEEFNLKQSDSENESDTKEYKIIKFNKTDL